MEYPWYVGFATIDAIRRGLRPGDTATGRDDSTPHITVYKLTPETAHRLVDYKEILGLNGEYVPFVVAPHVESELRELRTKTPGFAYAIGSLNPEDVLPMTMQSIEMVKYGKVLV